MCPGATAEHIEVTNGGSEANCIAIWHLLQPGDQMVMMTPNYMQVRGLARGVGAEVRDWRLVHDRAAERWRPDLDALSSLVSDRTKVLAICNPNNPTGARFSEAELDAICGVADRVGAWVLADEIYRGAEREGDETPTIWGRSDRAIVTSGLSKAYGLPGLRIGWVVGPPQLVETLWGVHDYTTIAPGALNDRLARMALERRERLLPARRHHSFGYDRPAMAERRPDALSHVPPEAGAIVFVRATTRSIPPDWSAFARRAEALVVPGDHFEMDGYLRLGFGNHPALLDGALERIGELIDAIPLADAR
jgi:aspartate/methionine/tyrosine aminotransferase